MARARRKKRTDVAKKTEQLICSKLGHIHPRTDRPFRRCERCGKLLLS